MDDDEEGDDDDVVPCAVRENPLFSWSILPPYGLRRLGFCLLDEFLESLFILSLIHFEGVKIADPPEAAARQTTAHASAHDRMERCCSL